MEILKGVLKEELENSYRRISAFEKALSALPKGSIHEKEIKGQKYYYLVYWDPKAKKNVFELMGKKLSRDVLLSYGKAGEQRADYRNQIRILKLEVHLLERVLRAREFSIAKKYSRKAA